VKTFEMISAQINSKPEGYTHYGEPNGHEGQKKMLNSKAVHEEL
jgi:hypothetical protein